MSKQFSGRHRPNRTDFGTVNRAALAVLPSILARLLPSGRVVGGEYLALNPRRADTHLGSFKVRMTGARAGCWSTSLPGTMAAIQFRSLPTRPMFRRPGRPGCSRRCLASKRGGLAVADGLDFSPITRDEIAAASAIATRAPDEGGLVSPVPADALPLDVKFKGRKPDECLWFYNATGERLCAECRWNFEGSAKEVRPACYTVQGWKLVAYPAPRPLYNLNKLTARPHDPVWLFEGPARRTRPSRAFRPP